VSSSIAFRPFCDCDSLTLVYVRSNAEDIGRAASSREFDVDSLKGNRSDPDISRFVVAPFNSDSRAATAKELHRVMSAGANVDEHAALFKVRIFALLSTA
jgi:hypothetical protein